MYIMPLFWRCVFGLKPAAFRFVPLQRIVPNNTPSFLDLQRIAVAQTWLYPHSG